MRVLYKFVLQKKTLVNIAYMLVLIAACWAAVVLHGNIRKVLYTIYGVALLVSALDWDIDNL